MANSIYLTLQGEKQGLISQSCCTMDSIGNKHQTDHQDQIFILAFSHSISRAQNAAHHPVCVVKPIDKSSPLLGIAISTNEILSCEFDFYRTNADGRQEKYYSILLQGATLVEISSNHPHTLTHAEAPPEETLLLQYRDISWKHLLAGTSGYSYWGERVY